MFMPRPISRPSTSDRNQRQAARHSSVDSNNAFRRKATFKMYLKAKLTTTLLSTLLSTTTALPQTVVNPGGITDWSVTNFQLGCSPGGCTYSFNISGPATPDVGPAFATPCSGTDVQNKLVACENEPDHGVYANLVPTKDRGLVLVVNRYGNEVNGNNGIMSGNATAAPAGEPAYSSFVVPAKFYGDVVSNGEK